MKHLSIVLLFTAACSVSAGTYQRAVTLPALSSYQALCTTHGAVSGGPVPITVDDPDSGAMRGIVPSTDGNHVAVAFTWDGDSVPPVKLADGTVRRQVCLKMRAGDGCNLVYVCWRVGDPTGPWVQVQVKSNPGKHTSAQCGANGYVKVTPTTSTTPADFRDGAQHVIAATINPDLSMSVGVDGVDAWVGALPDVATPLVGPAGLRSDNARWHGELYVDAECSTVIGD